MICIPVHTLVAGIFFATAYLRHFLPLQVMPLRRERPSIPASLKASAPSMTWKRCGAERHHHSMR